MVEGYRYPAVSRRLISGDEAADMYKKELTAGKRRPSGGELHMHNKPDSRYFERWDQANGLAAV